MGLREINALRTAKMIVDAAMELFYEHGYDATTMEQIAESAGIGTSTLYRYFPTKESVIVGFLGDPGFMAEELLSRSPDEPVEIALGHALVAFLKRAAADEEQGVKFTEIVETNARPRARLLEWLQESQVKLVSALAERTGRPSDDIHVAAMAWMAVFVLQRVNDHGAPVGVADVTEAARAIMHELGSRRIVTPTLEG